jgi:hypothetical protein
MTAQVAQPRFDLRPGCARTETEELERTRWGGLREERGRRRGQRGQEKRRGAPPGDGDQAFRTLAACSPFGPSTISNSTASPSRSERNPSCWIAV